MHKGLDTIMMGNCDLAKPNDQYSLDAMCMHFRPVRRSLMHTPWVLVLFGPVSFMLVRVAVSCVQLVQASPTDTTLPVIPLPAAVAAATSVCTAGVCC